MAKDPTAKLPAFAFGTAIKQGVNLGLVAVLFVVVFYWLLDTLTVRLETIDRQLLSVKNDMADMKALEGRFKKWWTPIMHGERIFIDQDDAKSVIKIGLARNSSEMLTYVCSDMLWLKPASLNEAALRATLKNKLLDVLENTRTFFQRFATVRGSLDTPLRTALPMASRPVSATAPASLQGDMVFGTLIEQVVGILSSQLEPKDRLQAITNIVIDRRRATEKLMIHWVEGTE